MGSPTYRSIDICCIYRAGNVVRPSSSEPMPVATKLLGYSMAVHCLSSFFVSFHINFFPNREASCDTNSKSMDAVANLSSYCCPSERKRRSVCIHDAIQQYMQIVSSSFFLPQIYVI